MLQDGDKIALGEEKITVLHTPGHTKGSVCYDTGDALITGDTIFADSIGRCDLWGGRDDLMKESLELLRKYDKQIKILPGHGPAAVIGNALDNAAYFI